MNYKQFFIFDAIGIITWAFVITMLGYFFGTKIPNIESYAGLAVIGVMIFTLGPTFYHLAEALWEDWRMKKNKEIKEKTKE